MRAARAACRLQGPLSSPPSPFPARPRGARAVVAARDDVAASCNQQAAYIPSLSSQQATSASRQTERLVPVG